MADVDPVLVQQVLDIAERKWKSNVHHDRQADDLGAAVIVPEGVCFRHQRRLRNRPARLKQFCSDEAKPHSIRLPVQSNKVRENFGKKYPLDTVHALPAVNNEVGANIEVARLRSEKYGHAVIPPKISGVQK